MAKSLSQSLKNIANRLGLFDAVMNEFLVAVEEESKRNAPTDKIFDAISIIPAKREQEGVYTGGIKVDLTIAPEGRAYELGSGLHGSKKQKYPIVPKNAEWLVFEWDKADPNKHIIIDGKVYFKKVMHPGVEARPYIEPAIEKESKGFRGLILRQIQHEFRTEFAKR